MIAFAIVLLPVFVRLNEVLKHAGAATGPMLSLLNFVQSADLFQGLALHWPKFFKDFQRKIASLFNSLNIGLVLMNWLNSLGIGTIPIPQCEFSLTYVQRWCLIIVSPLLFLVLYYTAVLVPYLLLWRALGLELLWKAIVDCWVRHHLRVRCCRWCRSNQSINEFEPEPEHEFGVESVVLNRAVDEVVDGEGHGWQFRAWHNGRGHWQEFTGPDQRKLTEAWNEGKHTVHLDRGEFKYKIDLKKFVQINLGTGRQRNVRKPAKHLLYRHRITRVFLYHSWDATLSNAIRFILLYLLVFYTFLAGTAMEPIACLEDIDLSQWITAAPSIACDWCSEQSVDEKIQLSYAQLGSLSIAASTVYGLGTPILFGVILWGHQDVLHSNKFSKRFGFLVTKMKTEYFWWETFISIRKLTMVCATKFADGQQLPCALINLFVTTAPHHRHR